MPWDARVCDEGAVNEFNVFADASQIRRGARTVRDGSHVPVQRVPTINKFHRLYSLPTKLRSQPNAFTGPRASTLSDRLVSMAICKSCDNEVDVLLSVKVSGKVKKMCEDCKERIEEEENVAEASESVVQGMMGFKGRR